MNKLFHIIVSSLFLCVTSVLADIERVSVSSSGKQGNFASSSTAISADGRYVVFNSKATNLVKNDTNGNVDVFVHDRNTGLTERVNVSSAGLQANNLSATGFSISAAGRFVAFSSTADNLVDNDTNGKTDIFIHDRQTSITKLVSVSSQGIQADQGTGTETAISADGRFVAYHSSSTSLVESPIDTNSDYDIFIHDRVAGITELISVSSAGTVGNEGSFRPSISEDGQFVSFDSNASNLVENDNNNGTDIFVHNRQTGIIQLVSKSSQGVQGNLGTSVESSISNDGRFVVFNSIDNNLVVGDSGFFSDVFIHDRNTGITQRINVSTAGVQTNNDSYVPSISGDGRFVIFGSDADNLVADDFNMSVDIFVHDNSTGITDLVSKSSAGVQGNNVSFSSSISPDGQVVVFGSLANNLINDDTNNVSDIFVTENQLITSNNDLISIEVLINGVTRGSLDDAAQLLTGTLYEVKYKVTNNSPDRLTGVQIAENGKLVCDVYALNPGQTKQRSRCISRRTVLSGDNHIQPTVTGRVAGSPKLLTYETDAYYTGIDNATGMLRLTHRINNINADSESQAPTLDSSKASVSFKIENTGEIELYRVKTYHDPASPVNSGWDLQCFIGTLTPGQIRYCKRDINLSPSGLHKVWGRVQGKSANISPTGTVNAANPTYFVVP